jgi:hypothetical protein
MKNFFNFFRKKIIWVFLSFTFLLLLPLSIFAQSVTPTPAAPFDIMSLFTSFAGFGAGIIVITGLITNNIGNWSAHGKSILSWVVAILTGLIGFWLKLGIFNGIDWVQLIVIIVSFAIGSNVVYDITWLRNLLAGLKLAPKKST